MTLLLIEFNNYFNRIVKKYDSYEDYISKSTNYHFIKEQYNFNPNDGVNANVIINWTLKWNPDYLLCLNDNNEIVSRWYIMESVRTRGGQYSISLRRDVISDKYDTVLDSPCFIQKGFVSDDNPLIFNKEDFLCNQIKIGESIITDSSRCSWIVLYYNLSKKNDLTGTVSTIEEPYTDIGSTLENFNIYQYKDNPYKLASEKYINIHARDASDDNYLTVQLNDEANVSRVFSGKKVTGQPTYSLYFKDMKLDEAIANVIDLMTASKSSISYQLSRYGNEQITFENFIKWNNKVIKTSDNNFYRIHITPSGEELVAGNPATSTSLYSTLVSAFRSGGTSLPPNWYGTFNNAFGTSIIYTKYSVNFENIGNTATTYNFNFTNAKDIVDQPYGIIALPYKSKDTRTLRFDARTIPDNLSLLVARELCKAGVGQDKVIYDAQILPYCPLNLSSTGFINTIDLNVGTDLDSSKYEYIYNGSGGQVGIALFPSYAKFTKNIDAFEVLLNGNLLPVSEDKVENQLTNYRIVSPNYNGMFEFNRARIRELNYFNIDCTYKPYTPYIHVNPDFKGLYGNDFNDARGLICGGDFSLSVASDAFETYKLQNKNFNEIFDRKIENMDVQYDINRTKNIVGLGLGVGKGVVGGAIAGGNPLSLGLGATTGLASGITNLVTAKKSYEEQRDLTIDMHNFQLQNIQALPDSLTKVDAYNNNNKIFPFLEKYSCTDEEKEIFRNKLKYEGMTVNAIGKIRDYLQFGETTFVKGQLLRLEELKEDNHFANEIFTEIAKGVYIA